MSYREFITNTQNENINLTLNLIPIALAVTGIIVIVDSAETPMAAKSMVKTSASSLKKGATDEGVYSQKGIYIYIYINQCINTKMK